ncbi:myelin and lymphocyte protein-like [Discoglossus pictus]
MAATTTAPVYGDVSALPSGLKVFTTFPDVLMITDFIFGGLVWILIAASRVPLPIIQGWVMFVSVTFFVCTFLLLLMYCVRVHGGKPSWTAIDAFYHSIAALFYLSASVLQSVVTMSLNIGPVSFKLYQENIAAVVFAYLATLSYFIHAIFCLLRWKRS